MGAATGRHIRKTRIVCTIGPASQCLDELAHLIQVGMDVARCYRYFEADKHDQVYQDPLKTSRGHFMDAKTLFYIGIILGFIGGVALTLVFVSVKSLFSGAEVRKLRQEKKALEKRIQEKNRHIDEMMGHAERLARDFGKQKSPRDG